MWIDHVQLWTSVLCVVERLQDASVVSFVQRADLTRLHLRCLIRVQLSATLPFRERYLRERPYLPVRRGSARKMRLRRRTVPNGRLLLSRRQRLLVLAAMSVRQYDVGRVSMRYGAMQARSTVQYWTK